MIYKLPETQITIHGTPAFIAPSADIMGDVSIAADVSIWFTAVVRGDEARIDIGKGTNIQDGAVLHVDTGYPLSIGSHVTVGHMALLHGCTIGDNTLVGMNATIMNGAVVGRNCIIGAGTLITEHKNIPDGSLVVGAPGKIIRTLTPAQIEKISESARHYIDRAKQYGDQLRQSTD